MNYTTLVNTFGLLPYEVWVKTDKSSEEIWDAMDANFKGSGRF